MDRLKISLFRYKTLVFGSVISMADELREDDEIVKDKGTGFSIGSTSLPELSEEQLYLGGTITAHDNDIFSYDFESEERAARICEVIAKLVDEINLVKKEIAVAEIIRVL